MSVKIPLKVNYPRDDIQGDSLAEITGAQIYIRHPGSREFVLDGFLKYGANDDTYWVELAEDGYYSWGFTVITACAESEMSPPAELVVNVQPPERPIAGSIVVPCPQRRDGVGAIFEYSWTIPANDIGGSKLLYIQGTEIETILPGNNSGDDANPVLFIHAPLQDAVVRVERDGSYRVRHRIVGACSRSEWSDATPVGINLQPAARPAQGSAIVPCSAAPLPDQPDMPAPAPE